MRASSASTATRAPRARSSTPSRISRRTRASSWAAGRCVPMRSTCAGSAPCSTRTPRTANSSMPGTWCSAGPSRGPPMWRAATSCTQILAASEASRSTSSEGTPVMQLPRNTFKEALRAQRPQIGLWLGLADAYATELLASTGFDWLAIDAEHAPNDPRSVLAQLQALAPYPAQAVVRTASADATLLKQYLDVGAQTLLVPMVESAAQAQHIVAATRYPP